MFKKSIYLFILLFLCTGKTLADPIFTNAIEKSANNAVDAWLSGDDARLKLALEDLTLNESYLLAIGKSKEENSYLSRIPVKASKNLDSMVAYIYLIKKEKRGVALWPESFFKGQRFEFMQRR